jgi:predicted nucleic acid-binding protein
LSAVSNTGPLVALAKIDLLSLLQELYGEVSIPPAVHRELLAKSGPEAPRLDAALQTHLRAVGEFSLTVDVEQATAGLGAGEQQAIALANSLGELLLIDDRSGRSVARRLGVPVTGTAGVLLRAKEAGLVAEVRSLLESMRAEGYYLSDALIDLAAKLAGEPGRPT